MKRWLTAMEEKKSSCSTSRQPLNIYQNFLGRGTYGCVYKRFDQAANCFRAIKKFTSEKAFKKELKMLTYLMENNLHEQNIIRFFHSDLKNLSLALELCSISLADYIKQLETPMPLQDIRIVIQQLATAFDALKKVGVIHTDVKTNNIMLVDQMIKPLQVKLIDFGLSVFTKDAKFIRVNQVLRYKAPELLIGLPFSEALDIWSLGCVMSEMVFKFKLFPGADEEEVLYYMMSHLGSPPDDLLRTGYNTENLFYKTNNQWLPKDPQKYSEIKESCKFRTLDNEKVIEQEIEYPKASERKECIALLKAMLTWDANKRITPSEILTHPFISVDSSRFSSSSLESISMLDPEPCTSRAPDPHERKAFAPRMVWEASSSKVLRESKKETFLKRLFCCCMLKSNVASA